MITARVTNKTISPTVINKVINAREPVNFTMNITSQRKEITFNASDTSELSRLIGNIGADLSIHKVRMDILSAFDTGIFFTVGDAVGQGRLMTAAQSNPQMLHSYIVEPDYAYSTATNVRIYFGGGASAAGSGRIIIYYS